MKKISIKKLIVVALGAAMIFLPSSDAFARGCCGGGGGCGGGRGCGGCRPCCPGGGGWCRPCRPCHPCGPCHPCRPCRPCGPGWGCGGCGCGGDWWGRGGRNFWPGFIAGAATSMIANNACYGGVVAAPAVAAAPVAVAQPVAYGGAVAQPVYGGAAVAQPVYQQTAVAAQPVYAAPAAQPLVGASVNVLGIRAGVGVGF